MASSKIRPLGQSLLELEELITEMIDQHELQWGDILGLTHQYLVIHRPDAQEQYNEGGHPEFYYGPRRDHEK